MTSGEAINPEMGIHPEMVKTATERLIPKEGHLGARIIQKIEFEIDRIIKIFQTGSLWTSSQVCTMLDREVLRLTKSLERHDADFKAKTQVVKLVDPSKLQQDLEMRQMLKESLTSIDTFISMAKDRPNKPDEELVKNLEARVKKLRESNDSSVQRTEELRTKIQDIKTANLQKLEQVKRMEGIDHTSRPYGYPTNSWLSSPRHIGLQADPLQLVYLDPFTGDMAKIPLNLRDPDFVKEVDKSLASIKATFNKADEVEERLGVKTLASQRKVPENAMYSSMERIDARNENLYQFRLQNASYRIKGLNALQKALAFHKRAAELPKFQGVSLASAPPRQAGILHLANSFEGYKLQGFTLVSRKFVTVTFQEPHEIEKAKSELAQKLSIADRQLDPSYLNKLSSAEDVKAPPLTRELKRKTDLKSLFKIFDSINFDKPERSDYVNPNSLRNDESSSSVEEYRRGLKTLISMVESKGDHYGVPKSRGERKQYYEQLEGLLRGILLCYEERKKSDPEAAKREFEAHVLILAEAGLHCGSRWENECFQLYGLASGKGAQGTGADLNVHDYVLQGFDQLKLQAVDEMVIEGVENPGYDPQHGRLNYLRTLQDAGIKIPGGDRVRYTDEFERIGWSGRYQQDNVKRGFLEKFHALRATELIHARLNNLMGKTSEGAVMDAMRNVVKSDPAVKEQLAELEKSYNEEKKQIEDLKTSEAALVPQELEDLAKIKSGTVPPGLTPLQKIAHLRKENQDLEKLAKAKPNFLAKELDRQEEEQLPGLKEKAKQQLQANQEDIKRMRSQKVEEIDTKRLLELAGEQDPEFVSKVPEDQREAKIKELFNQADKKIERDMAFLKEMDAISTKSYRANPGYKERVCALAKISDLPKTLGDVFRSRGFNPDSFTFEAQRNKAASDRKGKEDALLEDLLVERGYIVSRDNIESGRTETEITLDGAFALMQSYGCYQ